MVQKLDLKMDPHPKPYKLSWLQEGSDIKVKHRCLVSFTIGKHYQDEEWCNVVPMDVCHLLLGRPWQYDRQIIYDGFKNTYTIRKDGKKIVLAPLKPTIAPASKPAEQSSLLSKSELEKEIRAGSDVMALVAIEENESEKENPKEVEPIMAEFVEVVPEEIPHGLPPNITDIPRERYWLFVVSFSSFRGRCCPFFRALGALGLLVCHLLFVGLCPFWNKFLLIQKKKIFNIK